MTQKEVATLIRFGLFLGGSALIIQGTTLLWGTGVACIAAGLLALIFVVLP